MDASNQALVRQSPNKAFYHATEKGCTMEARVHLEKFVIKAHYGSLSRQSSWSVQWPQCFALEKWIEWNDLRSFSLRKWMKGEWTLENKSRKSTIWVGLHDKCIYGLFKWWKFAINSTLRVSSMTNFNHWNPPWIYITGEHCIVFVISSFCATGHIELVIIYTYVRSANYWTTEGHSHGDQWPFKRDTWYNFKTPPKHLRFRFRHSQVRLDEPPRLFTDMGTPWTTPPVWPGHGNPVPCRSPQATSRNPRAASSATSRKQHWSAVHDSGGRDAALRRVTPLRVSSVTRRSRRDGRRDGCTGRLLWYGQMDCAIHSPVFVFCFCFGEMLCYFILIGRTVLILCPTHPP